MWTFLIVVAAIIVGLPLALLLAVVVLKWYIGHKLKDFGGSIEKAIEQMAAMAGATMPGMKIELKPAEQTPWHHPAEIAEASDLLTGKGFVEVDRYLVNGSNAIIMGLYHHPADHIEVALYDTKENPPKMDVSASYEDGERYIFYTNIKHDGLDKPPYTSYERLQEMSNSELLEAALAGLPGEGRDPIDPATMVDEIKKVYEREQLWRVNRGGYTEQEIINTLKSAGEVVTKDTIESSMEAMNESLADELDDLLREDFLKTVDMPASEWEEIEDRFISVHPLSRPYQMVIDLTRLYPEDEQDRAEKKLEKEIKKRLETETPIEVFAALAQGTPREAELKKLGETSEPVRAVYYATPPYEDEEEDD